MANIERRMGEVMGFSNFDPEAIDVSEIQALSESIPRDGHVDLAMAPVLACKFLRGADICGELLAILSWWCAKKDDMKKLAVKVYKALDLTEPATVDVIHHNNDYIVVNIDTAPSLRKNGRFMQALETTGIESGHYIHSRIQNEFER
jgi:hypothetical protein